MLLLMFGISTFQGRISTQVIFSWGLGAVMAKTLIHFWTANGSLPMQATSGLLVNSIIANIPQVVLSLIYFSYNGLFTSMSLATEWSSFAKKRKGLRVSSQPTGSQRSSYFLQLPYRFAVPLILFSILLHWLIGQSLFLVAIEVYSTRGGLSPEPTLHEDSRITSCGWSPVAILCVIIAALVLVIFLFANAARRLPTGMPVAGSCSIAMAAACHSVPYEPEASTHLVIWGATEGEEAGSSGHCSFSDRLDVEYPKAGHIYR